MNDHQRIIDTPENERAFLDKLYLKMSVAAVEEHEASKRLKNRKNRNKRKNRRMAR